MTYSYKCTKNPEHLYSETRSIHEDQKQVTCIIEGCDGKLSRVFSAPPIRFKGSGFSTKSPFV
jgi:predicted nucleic acid-binding Zn ribbon protein